MPLDRPQRSALRRAVIRELTWGLGAASRELRAWRELALSIPDGPLRDDALHAIDRKRGHAVGAALFWTLPTGNHPMLLRLLVAYEVIYDYLDNVSERGAEIGEHNSRQLFRALADALDPDAATGDYYRFHPWADDGGYLAALVEACRACCRALPGFAVVRPLIAHEAGLLVVLGLNHELDPGRRDAALAAWAAERCPDERDLAWYELGAAASHSATVFALLALACSPAATRAQAEATSAAYFPWFSHAGTMLDSFVDQAEDLRNGAHSYVSHYPDRETSVRRLCESVEQAAGRLRALPHGERHAVLLGCMVAMYLSKDSARNEEMLADVARIVRAGGSLTRALVPVLRVWRLLNGQAAAT